MKRVSILFFAFCCLFSISTKANNIKVSNVGMTGQNAGSGYTLIQFDLSWENSWRISAGPSNYDGAWVFVKYRFSGGDWAHASINYVDGTATNDGHIEATGSTITTSSDGVGAFVYRGSDGSGDVNFTGCRLRWNYGADGVANSSVVDIQVYAIEMVYVPQGEYELGSSSTGTERDFFYGSGPFLAAPYTVNSENAITVSNTAGDLYYTVVSSENNGDQMGPIPATFPKGFAAFWCMKYEVTEDQWICFFNSLTTTQKTNHDLTDGDHKSSDMEVDRNTVSYTSVSATSTAPDRPCSYASYNDMAAYLDWTGLRFLTELEFEKACKGPTHTPNMLASGEVTAYSTLYVLSNDGQPNELITNPGENITNQMYTLTSPVGPSRVGIFAASAVNASRAETGATFYGIMEMGGNLYERCIGVGTPLNRAYTGQHGDGEILGSGAHNVTGWPAPGTQGAIAYRGGSWANVVDRARVADRESAAILTSVTNSRVGIRGCRSVN